MRKKITRFTTLFFLLLVLFIITGCKNDKNQKDLIDSKLPPLSQLYDADFVLYHVFCGMEKDSENQQYYGIYQSTADQELKEDSTKKTWGYHKKDWMVSEIDTKEEVLQNKWIVSESSEFNPETDGFEYEFEVPQGIYEIIVGFVNPFSFRTVDIKIEDEIAAEKIKLLKYQTVEEKITKEIKDGVLNLMIYNPKRGSDIMKNPILSYIIVKVIPEYNKELLSYLLEEAKEIQVKENVYTPSSFSIYSNANKIANDLYQALQKEDIKEENNNAVKIKETYQKLKTAIKELELRPNYNSFYPGEVWKDIDGIPIQAHGGQVQWLTYKEKDTGKIVSKWWWVGEDKSLGYRGGVRAYSSDDLYNWTFEGVILQTVSSREELNTNSYFTSLYTGHSKEELDHIYECINNSTSVIERPKLIYNEKNKQYVLWFHADGPTKTSDANYAAASAGVAVSDSPYGPFRFINRYRLNVCPEDQEDMYPESKGMARDMTLFVDDDKTAYIIYSSEENLTLYISKLNEDYTYLSQSPEKAVYGRDFIRIFPGAQREAPAVFKKDGYYYMMTSGTTGWEPNQARYFVSNSMLGEWKDFGDPCIDDIKKTTFDSQSTCIFKAADNTYIYMGDKWNSKNLTDSRYVWLKVNFTQEGKMELYWREEWKLEDLIK